MVVGSEVGWGAICNDYMEVIVRKKEAETIRTWAGCIGDFNEIMNIATDTMLSYSSFCVISEQIVTRNVNIGVRS